MAVPHEPAHSKANTDTVERNPEVTSTGPVCSVIQSNDRMPGLGKSWFFHVSKRICEKRAHPSGLPRSWYLQATLACALALGKMQGATPVPVPQSAGWVWGIVPGWGPAAAPVSCPRWSGGPRLTGGSSCLLCILGEKIVRSPTSEASICCTNSLLKYA